MKLSRHKFPHGRLLTGFLAKERSEESSDQEADVTAMYEGKQYIMHTYKVFRDIRIVYAPPRSIGNYGDEIDNWVSQAYR